MSEGAARFEPELTPPEMLALGVFGGDYFGGIPSDLPAEWFVGARLSDHGKDASYNFYGVDASLALAEWEARGWIHPADPLGWFQWYCRYFLGRRLPEEDDRQIKRWRAMRRHVAAVERHCEQGDLTCRRKQRQALLHWAYDSRRL